MDHEAANDSALAGRARNGDEAAFNAILLRYQRPILDFVYRMIGDSGNAQDVAQTIFVRAWRGLPRFEVRPNASFSTWLFQIARNACIDFNRRRARDPLRQTCDDPAILDSIPSSSSANNSLVDREIGQAVAAAVAALPEDQRTAIVLAEYEDMALADIALVMQRSVKAVESSLYRARQTLRERLRHLLT